MTYMVIYRTPEGSPGYQAAEHIDEAVAHVERLRNDDGVDQARIYRLEEIPFEFRPYYRVEVQVPDASDGDKRLDGGSPDDGPGDGGPAGWLSSSDAAAEVAAEVPEVPLPPPDDADPDERGRGLFGR